MTPSTPRAPFVVVPQSGEAALAVLLNRGVRDPFAREFLAGMTCGFTVPSAVSLILAGYGTAFCFDEDAADRWIAALEGTDLAELPTAQRLERFSGPFIEKVRKEDADHRAQMAEEDRAQAEAKLELEKMAAAKKLEEDQLAAAEADRLRVIAENQAAAPEPQVPAVAAVSMADVSDEELKDPAPAPTPPAPEPTSRRGSKSPRGA